MKFLAYALFIVANRVSADYSLTSFHNELSCGGPVIQTVANYLNCIASVSQKISYDIACVNASAMTVSYYENVECGGAVVHSAEVGWPADCQGSPDGKSTYQNICTKGSFAPSASAINTFSFYGQDECPLTDLRYSGVVSIPRACQRGSGAGGAGSYLFGCDKLNVTATPFKSADCSGKSSPPVPIGALGCKLPSSSNDGVTFTTCSAVPGSVASSSSSAPTKASDAVGAAVAEGMERAIEIIRNKRA